MVALQQSPAKLLISSLAGSVLFLKISVAPGLWDCSAVLEQCTKECLLAIAQTHGEDSTQHVQPEVAPHGFRSIL